ncbi:MAG: hypothetical protein RL220_1743 [Bacteroidota bacterium]
MRNRCFLCLLVVLAVLLNVTTLLAQDLKINEIMASNATGEMDDFLERDDWVEIYNAGALTNLAGYYLSDDPDSLDKWLIPSTNLGVTAVLPGSHIIFWIDRDPEQGEDHADFSLTGDGESFIITMPDGVTIVDSVTFPLMAPDISYGRVCDGCDDWQYFNNVTFDAPNGEVVMPPNTLFINEVQVNNVSTVADPSGDYDQWFEVYNPNNFQVNLAGYYISNTSDPLQYQIPNTNPYRTVIPANGFLLIWCDNETNEDTNHAPFTLNSASGTITLTAPNGTTLTDSYAYTGAGPDDSYGRISDGAVSSITFTSPTPRVTNGLIFIEPALVYINEVLPANQSDVEDNAGEREDWIEIYNPNNFAVNLAGYYLSDNPENPMKWQVPTLYPDSVTVPPNSWMLFYPDEDITQGVLHCSFRLSNNGEWIGLYSPDGFSVADQISWEYIAPDTSYGRITDGNPDWWMFIVTTPDASNNQGVLNVNEAQSIGLKVWPNPVTDRLFLNEIMDVQLFSFTGELVMDLPRVNSIDVSALPSGMYLLRSRAGIARIVVN